jgi:hypothetical protein
MTEPLDQTKAEARARGALADWGAPADRLIRREVEGGWRFSPVVEPDAPQSRGRFGSSDVVVRRADGAVFRIPAGASDETAGRVLSD